MSYILMSKTSKFVPKLAKLRLTHNPKIIKTPRPHTPLFYQNKKQKSKICKGQDDSGSVKSSFCLTPVISKFKDAAQKIRVQQVEKLITSKCHPDAKRGIPIA